MEINNSDIRMILNKAEKFMMHGVTSGDFYSEVIVPHKSGLYCVSVSQSADDIVEDQTTISITPVIQVICDNVPVYSNVIKHHNDPHINCPFCGGKGIVDPIHFNK